MRDTVKILSALIPVFCFGETFFLCLPFYADLLARDLDFSTRAVGTIVFAHVSCLAFTAFAVALIGPRLRVRVAGSVAIVLAVVSNLVPLLSVSFAALFGAEAAAGVAVGLMLSMGMQQAARTQNPNRVLSILIACQTFYTTVLLAYVLPAIAGRWHLQGAFASIALVAVTCIPSVLLDAPAGAGSARPSAGGFDVRGGVLSLGALFLFYVSVGVLWTFVERVGSDAGFAYSFMNYVIAAGNFACLPACLSVPRLVGRFGLAGVSRGILVASSMSIALLQLPVSRFTFALAVLGFMLSWSIGSVTLFTTIPHYDSGERLAAFSPGCALFGAASGALVSGNLAMLGGFRAADGFCLVAALSAMALYFRLGSPLAARSQ